MVIGNSNARMQNGTAYARVITALDQLGAVVRHHESRAEARCPAHEDRKASLSVASGRGLVLIRCHAGCDYEDVTAALGLSPSDLFDDRREVQYRYDNGLVVHRGAGKTFRQSGGVKGQRVLYLLSSVKRAVAEDREVWLVEGEKDADTMVQAYDVTATTWSMGASSVDKTDFSPLAGARVRIVQDDDKAGEKATKALVSKLLHLGCRVSVLRAKSGKDASDHYASGHSIEDFVELPLPTTTEPERSAYTAGDLLSMTFPEQSWVVDGLISEGLTMLVGAPKLGKSWMALEMAVAVASGRPAFGTHEAAHGDVLYLALEDTTRRMQSRLRTVGATADDILEVQLRSDTIGNGFEECVSSWISRHPNAKMIVVDVLSKVRGPAGRGTTYADEYADMGVLKDIADAYGIAVVVIHHTRKAEAIDAVDTVSGTNALAGACDTVIVLDRARGKHEAKLSITGRDIEEAELAATLNDGRWTILDGTANDHAMGETRKKIVACLREHGPLAPKEIAALTGINYENVKRTCPRMHADRQIKALGDGTYRVASASDRPTADLDAVPAVPVSPTDSEQVTGTPNAA